MRMVVEKHNTKRKKEENCNKQKTKIKHKEEVKSSETVQRTQRNTHTAISYYYFIV